MASTALILGSLAAAGGIGGAAIGAKASGSAADKQVAANQSAIDEQAREFDNAQVRSAPFVEAGQKSIGQLMQDILAGKFNPGSAPEYMGGPFKAPTAQEAESTPGYQFTRDQASKVLQQQMNAQGQGTSGGEKQALARFVSSLADSTYGDTFNRSLATYNAGLSGYQAQLAGYGAKLAGQAQEFGQEFAPALLGAGQATGLNSLGQSSAQSIGQLMMNIGNSQAAGTVGIANSINGGISSATSGITDAVLLKQFGLLGNQSKGPRGNYQIPDLGVPPG